MKYRGCSISRIVLMVIGLVAGLVSMAEASSENRTGKTNVTSLSGQPEQIAALQPSTSTSKEPSVKKRKAKKSKRKRGQSSK